MAVSVGFVVDDAIVMIENIYANLETGMKPMKAALEGAKQIGFTVVSISLSLLAAFIPLFFMGGIVGRFFQTFSLTLGFTIVVSTLVSLTLTPMICGHRLRAHDMEARPGPFGRVIEGTLGAITNFYGRTLKAVLHHRVLSVLVILACVVMSAYLYVKVPKGFIPQDDTGFVQGGTQAATDISYPAMVKLQQQAADIVAKDPAVSGRRLVRGWRRLFQLGQSRAIVHFAETRVGARLDRRGDRPAAQAADGHSRVSAPSCFRRAISAPARVSLSRNISSRSGARITTSWWNGRRKCSNACRLCRN